MAANADEVFTTTSAPASPGGTTVQNGVETVTVTASKLFDWKKAALIAFILLAVYVTWRQTRDN